MNILITGGAGFIGSHLTKTLLDQGHHIRVLDNFSTGKMANLPQAEATQLKIINADICDNAAVIETTSAVDAIIHLAAIASVQASVDDPVTTHAVNLGGTINLLEAARLNRVPKFVFSSSAAVYGNVKNLPTTESTQLAPLTPYAADKLASEHYIDFYRRQHGINTSVFRFFNIYGPRQDPSSPYSGVISIFIERAIKEQGITIYGDGQQSRDFVFVSDLTRVLSQAVTMTNAPTTSINIGNGEKTSLLELLHIVESLSQKKLNVCYSAARPGDIRCSLADNTYLQETFHYAPKWTIQKGLEQTYHWYKNNNTVTG
ncbi:MAG: NAD-dependent epimerase/dehydratase family protein [Thermodesulfobacteriota bacterium]|nr:NAD-dependent epimerase/dehydratase family protein [Thermodesulfobacteriota bacterium]